MAGSSSSSSRKSMQSYRVKSSNLTIAIGDDLYVRPPKGKPWIAKVDKILGDEFGRNVTVVCKWYYRPEGIRWGKKDFHGTSELILSNHYHKLSLRSINGKCKVHTLQDYQKLETIGPDDYYCRLMYDWINECFETRKLQVYCYCEMPDNPDLKMVQCEGCKDWFHIRCIGMTDAEIEAAANFFCTECRVSEVPSRNPAALESHQERTPARDEGLQLLCAVIESVIGEDQ